MRWPAAIERWWHCATPFEEINRKLQRAGVRQHDPMAPLISEMALAPRRMGRWLVVWVFSLLLVLGFASALLHSQAKPDHLQITPSAKGRLVVIEAPLGARIVDCPAGTVCVEIFSKQ